MSNEQGKRHESHPTISEGMLYFQCHHSLWLYGDERAEGAADEKNITVSETTASDKFSSPSSWFCFFGFFPLFC